MTQSGPATAPPDPDQQPQLQVGAVLSVGGLSHGRLLTLAAAAPADGTDPVPAAVARTLRTDHPTLAVPVVGSQDVDPATPGRRYSLVRVRELPVEGGGSRDVVVMRGDLRAVLAASTAHRGTPSLLRRNANHVVARGGRPLVVAAAPVAPDGSVGEYRLQGFVGVHVGPQGTAAEDSPEGTWERVDLWSVSLRYQHWLNVALIFVLSCSGYYIMDPFFGPTAHAGVQTGYLMGWVRLVHVTAAFCWLVVGLTRLASSLFSRDRYLRWPTLWPVKSKEDVRNLGRVVGHYALIRDEAPLYLAHNPLQQFAYTALYAACAVQLVTGFVLFGLYHQTSPFWAVVSMPVHWFGIAPVRMFHAMMMFFLWAFAIMHIYLAVRADSLERHGGVSAMLNGGVWLRRGSKPVDAPGIE